MDGYATAYLIALAATTAVTIKVRSPARIYGAALLIVAWLYTITLQNVSGAIAHPVAFAVITFLLCVVYAVMGLLYDRIWAWIASGLHVAMLFTHLAYQIAPGASSFVYISILTAFSYLTMIAITATPLWHMTGGRHGRRSISYHGFMRGGCLDSSSFKAKRKT